LWPALVSALQAGLSFGGTKYILGSKIFVLLYVENTFFWTQKLWAGTKRFRGTVLNISQYSAHRDLHKRIIRFVRRPELTLT